MPTGSSDKEGQTGITRYTDKWGNSRSSKWRLIDGKKVYQNGRIYPAGMPLTDEQEAANTKAMRDYESLQIRNIKLRADSRAASRYAAELRSKYGSKTGKPAGRIVTSASTPKPRVSSVAGKTTRMTADDKYPSPSEIWQGQLAARRNATSSGSKTGGGGRKAGAAPTASPRMTQDDYINGLAAREKALEDPRIQRILKEKMASKSTAPSVASVKAKLPSSKPTRKPLTGATSKHTKKVDPVFYNGPDRSVRRTGFSTRGNRSATGGGGRRAGGTVPKRDAGYVKVGMLVPGGSRKKTSSASPPRGASTGGTRGSAGISRVGSMSMRGTASGISAQQGSSYRPGAGTRQGGGGSRMRAGKK